MVFPHVLHRTMATLFFSTLLTAADPAPELRVDGGAQRIFTSGEIPIFIVSAPLTEGQQADVTLTAVDLWGKPAWNTTVKMSGPTPVRLPGPAALGYYYVTANLGSQHAVIDLGIVPVQAKGQRRDSFFASNTSNIKTGMEADFLRRLGMRVQRVHFQPDITGAPDVPGGALPLDFAAQDAAMADILSRDQWVLPIAGYAFQGPGKVLKSPLAHDLGMHGPPRDSAEFVATWEQILRHYPDVTTFEFWNEPWIFGWTWADTPAEYRRFQKEWCEMALRVNPQLRLIAGNSSMFCEDHIDHDPASWKGLLQGTTHHPYSGPGEENMRSGSQVRAIDQGMVVTRRMGLPYYYLTEGGTEVLTPKKNGDALWAETQGKNNNGNAAKIVQYTVHTALTGCFQSNAQWNIGYGPAWTRANVTYAVMTSLLEDRPIVADIWPHHPLIWGAVFAHPRHVDTAVKALPRAGELAVRWDVPVPAERATDSTKVAVVWSNTGSSNQQLDQAGTLTIREPGDITALDCTGRPIPNHGAVLSVPFGFTPVYLLSDRLSVVQLRERIATAELSNVTPVTAYAQPLAAPADTAQQVTVRIENQLNRDLEVTVSLAMGGKASPGVLQKLVAGRLSEVRVPWSPHTIRSDNQYAVEVVITTPAGTVKRQQVLQVARFVQRALPTDGTLTGLDSLPAVILDSDRLKRGADLSQYLLNPHLEKPVGNAEAPRSVVRMWTGYDATKIYVVAAVNEATYANSAGPLAHPGRMKNKVELPYRTGMPDGLNHILYTGDSLMLSFGFRDRVPGWGRQMDDAWTWKGHFYDSDDHFVAHGSSLGDQLIRLWGPDTSRRTGYQTDVVPGIGPVAGGTVVIRRDEAKQLTVYALTLPRAQVRLFDPAAGSCRFTFALPQDKPVNVGRTLEFAEVAGVFDYWSSHGSFSPSWDTFLPCQVQFGIEH